MENKKVFENISSDDIQEWIKRTGGISNFSDCLWIIMLFFIFLGFDSNPNEVASYWRGKYEALKELHDVKHE